MIVSLTLFLPICLEQFARDNGFLLPDKTTPCTHVTEKAIVGTPEQRCVVKLAGLWIDTASFRWVDFLPAEARYYSSCRLQYLFYISIVCSLSFPAFVVAAFQWECVEDLHEAPSACGLSTRSQYLQHAKQSKLLPFRKHSTAFTEPSTPLILYDIGTTFDLKTPNETEPSFPSTRLAPPPQIDCTHYALQPSSRSHSVSVAIAPFRLVLSLH
mgnify:FL=1